MKIALVFMNDTKVIGRGAGYIAGSIAAAGYPIAFYDSFYKNNSEIVRQIAASDADICMVSTMTMNFPRAIALIRELKKIRKLPVLVGGIHPTIVGKQLLNNHPEIDYLCIGEGESMVIEFLHRFHDGSLFEISNLCYRKDGIVHANKVRPPEDLSKLPPFPWHLFNKESIVESRDSFLYVTASRGCPYNCTYCCNGIYLKHYGKEYIRFRPIDRVIEELRQLKASYNPRLFYFGDEMILSDAGYTAELFKKVKSEINTPYGLMARVEFITPELVELFRNTNCQYVAMGIECGDEEFRKKHLNRHHTNLQIEKAFSLLRRAPIMCAAFNIIGYPFENDDELTRKTVRLNRKIKPDYPYFTIFYPFPGTKLYDRCVELNLIDSERMEKTSEYYEESVLKNVFLKKKQDRITRAFIPIPFFDLLEMIVSGKGKGYILRMKIWYRGKGLLRGVWRRLHRMAVFKSSRQQSP